MWIKLEPRLDTPPSASATACPPSTSGCESASPSGSFYNPVSPSPANTDITNTASTSPSPPTPTITPTTTTTTTTAIPDAALATDIQSFGHRNFVGLLVLALLAFLGLGLWLAFGQLPRRALRRLRARFGGGGGGARAEGGVGNEEGVGDEDGKENEVGAAREGDKVVGAVETRAGARAPGSPESVELDVDTLEKNEGMGAVGQRTAPPRVRFA